SREHCTFLLEMQCCFADCKPDHDRCNGSHDQTYACLPGRTRARFAVSDILLFLVAEDCGVRGDAKRSGDDDAVGLPWHVMVTADSSKRLRELRKTSAGSAHRERPVPHLVGDT